jgi:hypothetical protein
MYMATNEGYTRMVLAVAFMLANFRYKIYHEVFSLSQMLSHVAVGRDRFDAFDIQCPAPVTQSVNNSRAGPRVTTIIGGKHSESLRFAVWWRDDGGPSPDCPTILPQLLVKIIHPSTVPSISWIHVEELVMHTVYQYVCGQHFPTTSNPVVQR